MFLIGIQCTDNLLTNCNASQPCLSGVDCAYSLEALFQGYNVGIHKYIYIISPLSLYSQFSFLVMLYQFFDTLRYIYCGTFA